jgi:hypothetical protein
MHASPAWKPLTPTLSAGLLGRTPAVILLWAAAIALMLCAAYSMPIRRHPCRPCRKWGESGNHRDAIFTSSFRDCARYGGTGRDLRPFAREPGHHSQPGTSAKPGGGRQRPAFPRPPPANPAPISRGVPACPTR